jgi:ABC-2 type transport system permease protein
MTGLGALLKKEIKEQVRTHRLLIVAGIFLFFGLTTPLTLKYLPEIIRMTGTAVPIDIPAPKAVDSLIEFAGTIGQLGVLVTVLIAMGAVANEIKRGTAVITLSKQVTHSAFVTSKLIAMSLTFLASLAVSSLFCYGYTVWLIGPSDALAYTELTLLLGLFLIFCLAVTTMFSSMFKSSLAAGGVGIGVIIALALFSTIPRFGDYLPGQLLNWGNNLINGAGANYWGALGVTVALIAVCLYLAQWALKRKEM